MRKQSNSTQSYRKKIQSLPALVRKVRKLQKKRQQIVFTNGCFDILHLGHIDYLERARQLGDCLVVALNRDASVRRLKGAKRPVNSERDRAGVLSGLASVDYVVFFSENTPQKVIQKIQPDILVKGSDWSISKIVGAGFVQAKGGKVKSLKFLQGRSTTKLLQKIHQL